MPTRRSLPKFDHHRCRSTGWCITVCPTDCLDMWNDRPYVRLPQACIDCSACVQVCPVQAVEMVPATVGE